MIEYLKDDLTEEPKETSNTDDVDLAEVANSDEAITEEPRDINEM